MDVYTTEDQQVEAIKKWWKKNGTSLVAGVLIGLSAVIGWRMWIDQKNTDAEVASAKYDSMMNAQGQGLGDIVLEQANGIIGQHPETAYAALAAILSAKISLEKGDTQAARNHYNWVITQSKSDNLKPLARLRLARVLLDAGEHQQALDLLGSDADSYTSLTEETRGDIYLAMNQADKAKSAYQAALDAPDADSGVKRILQMKIEDLGGSE